MASLNLAGEREVLLASLTLENEQLKKTVSELQQELAEWKAVAFEFQARSSAGELAPPSPPPSPPPRSSSAEQDNSSVDVNGLVEQNATLARELRDAQATVAVLYQDRAMLSEEIMHLRTLMSLPTDATTTLTSTDLPPPSNTDDDSEAAASRPTAVEAEPTIADAPAVSVGLLPSTDDADAIQTDAQLNCWALFGEVYVTGRLRLTLDALEWQPRAAAVRSSSGRPFSVAYRGIAAVVKAAKTKKQKFFAFSGPVSIVGDQQTAMLWLSDADRTLLAKEVYTRAARQGVLVRLVDASGKQEKRWAVDGLPPREDDFVEIPADR